jgi:hypothetical protein
MVKIWKANFRNERYYTKAAFLTRPIPEVHFNDVTPYERPFPRVDLVVESGWYTPTDFFWCGAMSVVSARLKEFLESFPKLKLEFFQVNVFRKKTKTWYEPNSFFCMHLMEELDCFDYERSRYKVAKGGWIIGIDSLVLKPSKLAGRRLFRIAGVGFVIWCVSEKLANEIEAQGFTGVLFCDPSELRW